MTAKYSRYDFLLAADAAFSISFMLLFSLAPTWYKTSVLLEQIQETTSRLHLLRAHAPKHMHPVHFPKLFVGEVLPFLNRPSFHKWDHLASAASVTLYDYLKSWFCVKTDSLWSLAHWKRTVSLPQINNRFLGSIPRHRRLLNCRLFNGARGWETLG